MSVENWVPKCSIVILGGLMLVYKLIFIVLQLLYWLNRQTQLVYMHSKIQNLG
jgi:hypothetical protein